MIDNVVKFEPHANRSVGVPDLLNGRLLLWRGAPFTFTLAFEQNSLCIPVTGYSP
jgi:hypothetical protein